MGFKPKRKIFRLDFREVEDMEGLIVRARSTDMETFLTIQEMAEGDTKASASLRALFAEFVSVVVEWNLEYDDRDETMPLTAESLLAQEPAFSLAIVGAWMEAMAGVTASLGKGSTPSSPPLAASLPMVTSSPSQQS